ncbi:MAG: carboxypeptidase-like regulatory domain-containing protein [Bacteroidales bacterium]
MNSPTLLFLLCSVPFVLSACTKEEALPLFDQGMIRGSVCCSESGEMASGARVHLFGPYGSASASSSLDGSYAFEGLGNGTYELRIEMDGYGSMFLYGIQVFGKDTLNLPRTGLYAMVSDRDYPDITAANTKGELDWLSYGAGLVLTTTYARSEEVEEFPLRFFFSTSEDVSPDHFLFSRIGANLYRYDCPKQMILFEDLFGCSGETLYVVGYRCNRNDPGYFDGYTGMQRYSTLERSQHTRVLKFTMP